MRVACLSAFAVASISLFSAAPKESDYERGWPMRSHDVRRTGRGLVNGPRKPSKVWTCTAKDGVVINIEPAVTAKGVYFGTWGVMRRHGNNKLDWDKCDGKIIGLDPVTGKPLWDPLLPAKTPYAYDYKGRKPTDQDKPAGPGLHWNWSNGTIEGTPAVDPKDGTLYVGRGDGCLYAVDPAKGKVRWVYKTLDPKQKDDPEGGGEIVGGPLINDKGVIVFATFAAPHRPDPPKTLRHETNAVYAVDRKGKMLWRFPKDGTLEAPFVAPVALSPDGKRVYAVTGLPDKKFPCEALALDLATGKRLWRMDLEEIGAHDIAVGIDGTLFVVGARIGKLGSIPTAFAIKDQGQSGKILWGPIDVDGSLRPGAHFAGGLALFEDKGKVVHLFVSSTLLRELNGTGGLLHRLDPRTGNVTATWNPEKAEPECLGLLSDISLDKEGVIFVGVRGRWKVLAKPEVKGRMYALRLTKDKFEVVWSHEVDGQIDWASPAIGPDGGLYFGSSAKINPLDFITPQPADKDVKDADPIFYGLRD